jgi:hypothetical protein
MPGEQQIFDEAGDTLTVECGKDRNGTIGGRIGAGTLTVIVEVTYDGTNWETWTVKKSDGTTTAAPAAGAMFWADVPMAMKARLRCTAFTSQSQPNKIEWRAG